MSLKLGFKDYTLSSMGLFESTGDNKYIIEATIAYACYRALGGQKVTPLPPFTNELYNIVYTMAYIRQRANGRITSSIILKIEAILTKEIPTIKSLKHIHNNNIHQLILTTTKGSYNLKVNPLNSTDTIVDICLICISELSDSRLRVNDISRIVYEFISRIGRS